MGPEIDPHNLALQGGGCRGRRVDPDHGAVKARQAPSNGQVVVRRRGGTPAGPPVSRASARDEAPSRPWARSSRAPFTPAPCRTAPDRTGPRIRPAQGAHGDRHVHDYRGFPPVARVSGGGRRAGRRRQHRQGDPSGVVLGRPGHGGARGLWRALWRQNMTEAANPSKDGVGEAFPSRRPDGLHMIILSKHVGIYELSSDFRT